MSDLLRRQVGAKRDGGTPWKDVRFRCSFHNTIYDVLKGRGFKETDAELDWDFFWCDKEWIHDTFDHVHLQPNQRINHFRNHFELTRKDLLVKNIKRACRQAQRDGQPEEVKRYNACTPTTFVLPQEHSMFVEEFKKQPSGTIWIMKPIGKAQGRGIFLLDKLSQINNWKQDFKWLKKDDDRRNDDEDKKEPEPYVIQKYLSSPLLIGGKKFDLRLYVLVTSYSPLTVYMYRSGFARFSHSRFSMDDIANSQVHLTNVAIQKQNDNYDEKRGGKWDLQHLKSYLISQWGIEKVTELFVGIQDLILSSLLAVQKVIIQDKHCFELYGYDIMISSDFRPWLIEVNASPSLTANTPLDYELKFAMLDDVLTIIDMERYLGGDEMQIGGFDLIYRNGCRVGPPLNAVHRCYLGCHNNRAEQLARLARSLGSSEQERRLQQEKQPPDSKSQAPYAETGRSNPKETGGSGGRPPLAAGGGPRRAAGEARSNSQVRQRSSVS